MNRRAFTTLEVVIALIIGALTLSVSLYFYSRSSKNNAQVTAKSSLQTELGRAFNLIHRVGRLSHGCTRNSATSLTCRVDFNIPSTGATTNVRIRIAPTAPGFLVYEVQTGGGYRVRDTFSGVTDFLVCGEAELAACGIQSQTLSTLYLANTNTNLGRFFRYRLSGNVGGGGTNPLVRVQSAFFVRNPGPAGIIYQWGSDTNK